MMKKMTLLILTFVAFVTVSAQTYKELTDQASDLIAKDSLPQAEILYLKALRLEPANAHNALIFSNMGTIQRHLAKYDEAIESYSYALNIAPNSIPILMNRATTYMELAKTDLAYIDYCQVLDLDKTNKEALAMRAYIYVSRSDYNAARADYNRLIDLDPATYSGRIGLVTLNQKEKKYTQALDIINQMIVELPDDAVLYVSRADIEQNMGLTDLALIDLEESIRLKPDSPEPFLLRGEIYLFQKKKILARQDFEKAVQLGIPQSDLKQQFQQCR